MLRRRLMVLDAALLGSPRELARILVHEVFHFVWLRLGNPARRSWERQLASEVRRGARGELGWSAELRKPKAVPGAAARSRLWRDYACESFCDSAACLLAAARRGEATLAPRFRNERRRWFAALLEQPAIPI